MISSVSRQVAIPPNLLNDYCCSLCTNLANSDLSEATGLLADCDLLIRSLLLFDIVISKTL